MTELKWFSREISPLILQAANRADYKGERIWAAYFRKLNKTLLALIESGKEAEDAKIK
jgi:hypothetical protein